MSPIPVSWETNQPTPLNEEQQQRQNLDAIHQHIMNTLNAFYVDTLITTATTAELTYHYFSQTTIPIFRHIPKEDLGTLGGWLSGHSAIRSYFDLFTLYWTRRIRVRQPTVTIDPVNRTCRFILDVDWEWCKPGLPGWSEVLECSHAYDWEYKVARGEYVTLSGRDTCWPFMKRFLSEGKVRDMQLIIFDTVEPC